MKKKIGTRTKKRFICVVCCAAMLITSLSACSKGSQTTSETEIKENTSDVTKSPTEDEKSDLTKISLFIDKNENLVNVIDTGNDYQILSSDAKQLLGYESDDEYVSIATACESMDICYDYCGSDNAAYIWTLATYKDITIENVSYYDRAISLGIVDEESIGEADEQISTEEYRDMLAYLLTQTASNNMDFFEDNITHYDAPMRIGEGIAMAYFAAVCMGIDTMNNSFDNNLADQDPTFWDTDGYSFEDIIPGFFDERTVHMGDYDWDSYHAASYLWNMWHDDPNGYQTFDFDYENNTFHQAEPLTYYGAVVSITKLYNSFTGDGGDNGMLSVDNPEVLKPNNNILTSSLLTTAGQSDTVTAENHPDYKGFVLGDITTSLVNKEAGIREVSEWGFNTICIYYDYKGLFNDDVTEVNSYELQRLDALVAAAIKYDIQLDLCTCFVPGRWSHWDVSTDESVGEFDLFINPEKQEQVCRMWQLIAERYKDVPSDYLSFTPVWEALNRNLSTGLEAPEYDTEDVADTFDKIVDAIREADPDRMLIYEPTPINDIDSIKLVAESTAGIIEKWDNILVQYNFCECPYVYAEMTDEEGAHIDNNNHGMFKPSYPATIYSVDKELSSEDPLTLTGCLPKGTTIEIYLEKSAAGDFVIMGDGEELCRESLEAADYERSSHLSGWYPFSTSEKCISITLEKDMDEVILDSKGVYVKWCGMNVILPNSYAVEKWYYPSAYDAFLDGEGNENPDPYLKSTSTVMICPYEEGKLANSVEIHEDVTYTTDTIYAQSNADTIKEWARYVAEVTPNCIVRIEASTFYLGTDIDSLKSYCTDIFTAFNEYGIGWYSNEYLNFMNEKIVGTKLTEYNSHPKFKLELLRFLQSWL